MFYVDLLRTLAAYEVRYVVVGGLALNCMACSVPTALAVDFDDLATRAVVKRLGLDS